MRWNLSTGPEPVGEDDSLGPLAIDRIEAVENDAVDLRASGRLRGNARPVDRHDLRFARRLADGSEVAPVRREADIDYFRNPLDDSPAPLRLSEKESLVDAAVVAAPLMRLDKRFGVPLVESDLGQDRHAPRTRVFSLQLGPKPPASPGEVGRQWVIGDQLATIRVHASHVVLRDEDDGDPIAELDESRIPASQSCVRGHRGSVHLRFVLPGLAYAFREGAGTTDVAALGAVEHYDHRWPAVAIEIDQVEYGAIDRSSITDRIDRRLVDGVIPEWNGGLLASRFPGNQNGSGEQGDDSCYRARQEEDRVE